MSIPLLSCRSLAASIALATIWCMGPCHGRLGSGVVSLTEANFDSFVRSQDRLVVDFFKKDVLDEEQAEFEKALRHVRRAGHPIPFAKLDAAHSPEIAERYVTNGKYPQIVWFRHGEVTKYHRTLWQAEDIKTFALDMDRDAIIPVQSTRELAGINRAIFFHTKKASALYKEMEEVALKHMDTIAFLLFESSHEEVRWVADGKPVDTYTGEFNATAIESWVRSMLIESEDVPDEPIAEDGSTVVVAKTFAEIVLREDKDVLLMLYAPWCGHCRKAFPTWKSLVQEVASVEHMVVAKMDSSRNRPMLEDFERTNSPTFFYVRAGEQKPSSFNGTVTLDGLLQFAKDHSTQEINVDIDAATTTEFEL